MGYCHVVLVILASRDLLRQKSKNVNENLACLSGVDDIIGIEIAGGIGDGVGMPLAVS